MYPGAFKSRRWMLKLAQKTTFYRKPVFFRNHLLKLIGLRNLSPGIETFEHALVVYRFGLFFVMALALSGCDTSPEDRLLACLQEASNKYAAIYCERSFQVNPEPECEPASTPEPVELDVAALEFKWVQPYLGSTLAAPIREYT